MNGVAESVNVLTPVAPDADKRTPPAATERSVDAADASETSPEGTVNVSAVPIFRVPTNEMRYEFVNTGETDGASMEVDAGAEWFVNPHTSITVAVPAPESATAVAEYATPLGPSLNVHEYVGSLPVATRA